jgi:choice-of-anchor C domain-containing protein
MKAARLLAFVVLVSGLAFANSIVVDGSFELNRYTDRPFTPIGAGNYVGAWFISSGSIDYINTYWPAVNGHASIDLNGWSVGSIYQDLHTVPGQQYRLSFYLSGNPDLPGLKPLDVLWNGAVVGYHVSSPINTWQNFTYLRFVFPDVVASGPITRLEFKSETPTVYGPVLDDVRVEAVPEPNSLLLIASGATLFALRTRHRR